MPYCAALRSGEKRTMAVSFTNKRQSKQQLEKQKHGRGTIEYSTYSHLGQPHKSSSVYIAEGRNPGKTKWHITMASTGVGCALVRR